MGLRKLERAYAQRSETVRADTVGKPLPGVELRILNPDGEGVGEVAARSKTIMSHYLDDAELTLETSSRAGS